MIESAQMESAELNPVMSRFSIVTALLTLSLTILFFLPAESTTININVFSAEFSFSGLQLIPYFIAFISLIGSYWILIANPNVSRTSRVLRQVLPNTVLPTITVMIFALILFHTDKGLAWWGVMGVGVLAYMIVFYSEYQVLNPDVSANTIFTILLIALAHALFMAFAIALRASTTRVFVLIPGVLISAGFVSFRTLSLRTSGTLKLYWLLIVIMITTQFSIALYYMFLTPNQYGLILTAILFTSNALTARIGQGNRKHLFVEPLVLTIFIVLFALLSDWV